MADVSKFIARAEEAFQRRNFQYAVQMYLEALSVDPGHIAARRNLRTVLLKSDEAGSKIQAPKGQTLVLSRDPKVMLAEFEKAVVKEPRSAKYNMRVAETLAKAGHHESAGYVYQYVITSCDKGKDNVPAMKAGAQAFIDAGKPDLATQLLAKAYKFAPNDKEIAELQRNLAAATYKDRISQATSSRDMLQDSDQAAELELLAKKVLSPDELKRAFKIVSEKLESDPSDKGLVKKKAELYGKARQYDKAYEFLMEKYREIDAAPDLAELAVRYREQYFAYMIQKCEQKAEQEPEKADSYRAKILELEKERQEFQLAEYERQVNDAPADLDKRYAFGKSLFDAGKFDAALPHLQRAQKSPKNANEVGVLLGRCFAEMGRLELAVRQLNNALEALGQGEEDLNMEARYWLADALARNNDFEPAKEMFQSLFMENASFRDVGQRLDALMAAK